VFSWPWRKKQEPDERTRIRAQHDSDIISITSFTRPRSGALANVESIDAMVGLAKKYEAVIMELPSEKSVEYLLWDNGLLFRHEHSLQPRVDSDDAASRDLVRPDEPGSGSARRKRVPGQISRPRQRPLQFVKSTLNSSLPNHPQGSRPGHKARHPWRGSITFQFGHKPAEFIKFGDVRRTRLKEAR
jgi:hypothetical protein